MFRQLALFTTQDEEKLMEEVFDDLLRKASMIKHDKVKLDGSTGVFLMDDCLLMEVYGTSLPVLDLKNNDQLLEHISMIQEGKMMGSLEDAFKRYDQCMSAFEEKKKQIEDLNAKIHLQNTSLKNNAMQSDWLNKENEERDERNHEREKRVNQLKKNKEVKNEEILNLEEKILELKKKRMPHEARLQDALVQKEELSESMRELSIDVTFSNRVFHPNKYVEAVDEMEDYKSRFDELKAISENEDLAVQTIDFKIKQLETEQNDIKEFLKTLEVHLKENELELQKALDERNNGSKLFEQQTKHTKLAKDKIKRMKQEITEIERSIEEDKQAIIDEISNLILCYAHESEDFNETFDRAKKQIEEGKPLTQKQLDVMMFSSRYAVIHEIDKTYRGHVLMAKDAKVTKVQRKRFLKFLRCE